MKRTYRVILEKCEDSPFPKSIRSKSLKKLVLLNYAMTISCLKTGVSTDDLVNNPVKCVKYIMKTLHMTKRTAYDYYTALLYINHHYEAYKDYIYDNIPV